MSIAVALAFAVLVVASALAPRAVQWPLSNRAARRLEDVSLGVFLYHMIVVYLALELLGIEPDGSRTSAVVLPTTPLVCLAQRGRGGAPAAHADQGLGQAGAAGPRDTLCAT